jgi:hypothetical protein
MKRITMLRVLFLALAIASLYGKARGVLPLGFSSGG